MQVVVLVVDGTLHLTALYSCELSFGKAVQNGWWYRRDRGGGYTRWYVEVIRPKGHKDMSPKSHHSKSKRRQYLLFNFHGKWHIMQRYADFCFKDGTAHKHNRQGNCTPGMPAISFPRKDLMFLINGLAAGDMSTLAHCLCIMFSCQLAPAWQHHHYSHCLVCSCPAWSVALHSRDMRDLILFSSSDGSKARALGVAENAPDLTAKAHSAEHRLFSETGHVIIMTAVDWTTSHPSSLAHWRALPS